MESQALSTIVLFYENIDVFLLIFVRILAFFIMVPVISGANIPMQVRIIAAICISALVFISGYVTSASYNDTVTGYFLMMLTEFLTGILIGYILYFIFNIIFYTGQLIDYQIGLSMMSVLDPITQVQVPIVGNLYYMAISAMLVVTGGLNSFLAAFVYSYQVLPIGAAYIVGNGGLAWMALTLLTEFLVLGVKIALPVVGSILVIDAVLGIMVKAVPQMNVFVVGMPIKLLVGLLLLLTVMVPTINGIYSYIFDMAYESMIDLIWGMSP